MTGLIAILVGAYALSQAAPSLSSVFGAWKSASAQQKQADAMKRLAELRQSQIMAEWRKTNEGN